MSVPTGPGFVSGAGGGPGSTSGPASGPMSGPTPGAAPGPTPGPTPYVLMGGEETFTRLVDAFYAGVAQDEPLRALYPEEDLGPAAERLRLFLMQYWGGPSTYSQTRGHPRLRIRHVPFAVTRDMRDRWVRHMMAACDEIALDEPLDAALRDYLLRAADAMVNTDG